MSSNPVFEWKTLRTVLDQKASLLNFVAMFKIKADLATLALHKPQQGGQGEGGDGAKVDNDGEKEGGDKDEAAAAPTEPEKEDAAGSDEKDIVEGGEEVNALKRSREEGEITAAAAAEAATGTAEGEAEAAAPEEKKARGGGEEDEDALPE